MTDTFTPTEKDWQDIAILAALSNIGEAVDILGLDAVLRELEAICNVTIAATPAPARPTQAELEEAAFARIFDL